jgi:heme/copper-type cytochrome/quinol oxidase subunit 2
MPDAQSERRRLPHEENQDGMSQQLAEALFWICAAGCALAELAILRAVFAPHGRSQSSAPIPHSPRGAEMMWAVIPAIALAALFAATWRAIH